MSLKVNFGGYKDIAREAKNSVNNISLGTVWLSAIHCDLCKLEIAIYEVMVISLSFESCWRVSAFISLTWDKHSSKGNLKLTHYSCTMSWPTHLATKAYSDFDDFLSNCDRFILICDWLYCQVGTAGMLFGVFVVFNPLNFKWPLISLFFPPTPYIISVQ